MGSRQSKPFANARVSKRKHRIGFRSVWSSHKMITTRVSPILAKELLIWPDLWLNIILHKTAPLGPSVGTFVPYMLPIGTNELDLIYNEL